MSRADSGRCRMDFSESASHVSRAIALSAIIICFFFSWFRSHQSDSLLFSSHSDFEVTTRLLKADTPCPHDALVCRPIPCPGLPRKVIEPIQPASVPFQKYCLGPCSTMFISSLLPSYSHTSRRFVSTCASLMSMSQCTHHCMLVSAVHAYVSPFPPTSGLGDMFASRGFFVNVVNLL
jgi:hypothetical protein